MLQLPAQMLCVRQIVAPRRRAPCQAAHKQRGTVLQQDQQGSLRMYVEESGSAGQAVAAQHGGAGQAEYVEVEHAGFQAGASE